MSKKTQMKKYSEEPPDEASAAIHDLQRLVEEKKKMDNKKNKNDDFSLNFVNEKSQKQAPRVQQLESKLIRYPDKKGLALGSLN